jgi:hypothetical protein
MLRRRSNPPLHNLLSQMRPPANVRADLRDKGDIESVIVASDFGGDTPQRLSLNFQL